MKSRDGRKTLWGARIPEEIQLDTIEFKDTDTKETNPVFVRFVEEVEDGVFSELDILSLNPGKTIAYTWTEQKPAPLKSKA